MRRTRRLLCCALTAGVVSAAAWGTTNIWSCVLWCQTLSWGCNNYGDDCSTNNPDCVTRFGPVTSAFECASTRCSYLGNVCCECTYQIYECAPSSGPGWCCYNGVSTTRKGSTICCPVGSTSCSFGTVPQAKCKTPVGGQCP